MAQAQSQILGEEQVTRSYYVVVGRKRRRELVLRERRSMDYDAVMGLVQKLYGKIAIPESRSLPNAVLTRYQKSLLSLADTDEPWFFNNTVFEIIAEKDEMEKSAEMVIVLQRMKYTHRLELSMGRFVWSANSITKAEMYWPDTPFTLEFVKDMNQFVAMLAMRHAMEKFVDLIELLRFMDDVGLKRIFVNKWQITVIRE